MSRPPFQGPAPAPPRLASPRLAALRLLALGGKLSAAAARRWLHGARPRATPTPAQQTEQVVHSLGRLGSGTALDPRLNGASKGSGPTQRLCGVRPRKGRARSGIVGGALPAQALRKVGPGAWPSRGRGGRFRRCAATVCRNCWGPLCVRGLLDPATERQNLMKLGHSRKGTFSPAFLYNFSRATPSSLVLSP